MNLNGIAPKQGITDIIQTLVENSSTQKYKILPYLLISSKIFC